MKFYEKKFKLKLIFEEKKTKKTKKMNRPTIMVFPMPAMGHMNPMFAIMKELVKTKNARMIIYSNESFKKRIEDNGCEYRYMGDFSVDDVQKHVDKNDKPVKAFKGMMEKVYDLIDNNITRIVNEIEEEKPNLILHDNLAVYAKWIIKLLSKRCKQHVNTFHNMPPVIVYFTTFVFEKNLYPVDDEMKLVMNLGLFDKIVFGCSMLSAMSKIKAIANKYGIDAGHPMEESLYSNNDFYNICFVSPQLHPRSHKFHRNTKFIGACINDGHHLDNLENVNDADMKSFLANISPVNPKREFPKQNEKILIYFSLGSIFRSNMAFYIKVIDAIKTFNQSVTNAKYNSENVYSIINVGSICYEEFKNLKYEVPNNIKITSYAPQLEILKRATIFVTHCGMNSVSESTHFGVPMICMPAGADQPLVAQRVTNELGLGVLNSIQTMDTNNLRADFHKILDDESIMERCYDYALLSHQHIGQKKACEIFEKHL